MKDHWGWVGDTGTHGELSQPTIACSRTMAWLQPQNLQGTVSPPPAHSAQRAGCPPVSRSPGSFPLITKEEIPLSMHIPCPLGKIPSWIYFCQFACLNMKGICRGECCNWPDVGQNPPYGVFRSSLVAFPPVHSLWGVRAGPQALGLLGRALFLIRAKSPLPLSWQCLWHQGLAATPESCGLPLETDKESTFCQQNPAQLPQGRRGEEEASGEGRGKPAAWLAWFCTVWFCTGIQMAMDQWSFSNCRIC